MISEIVVYSVALVLFHNAGIIFEASLSNF